MPGLQGFSSDSPMAHSPELAHLAASRPTRRSFMDCPGDRARGSADAEAEAPEFSQLPGGMGQAGLRKCHVFLSS